MTRDEYKQSLLDDPMLLIQKKPFYRGVNSDSCSVKGNGLSEVNGTEQAVLPSFKFKKIGQWEFLKELEPESHKVLFDDNVPSITMKTNDGHFVEIEYKKMALPIQKMLVQKHVLHLCGNPTSFTLLNSNPSEKERKNFSTIKQYWTLRNQEGMKTKSVITQRSMGDVGLLYYMDYKNEIKSRILSYKDGYVICSHNDKNGDRILESVYYQSNDVQYIDSYDDKYMYRWRLSDNEEEGKDNNGWVREMKVAHGFEEIPLVTKRGDVSWNNVQSIIEVYEVMYNIFMVIQKRHGWGILYVKGKFSQDGKHVAGAVILNDRSMDGTGSAEFKAPPTPQGYLETLDRLRESIQEGAGATFLLPKDIKMSGDISGIAVALTQSLDIENALMNVIDWQNFADKMMRLFKYGLAKELVSKKINLNAITEFDQININAKFSVWKPRNETEYNNMVSSLFGSKLISRETGIELNTLSKPDELQRCNTEDDKIREEEQTMVDKGSVVENIQVDKIKNRGDKIDGLDRLDN